MIALHPGETVAPQQVAWMTGGSPRAVAADFGVLRRHDLVTVGPDRRAVAHGLVRRLAVTITDQLYGVRTESMRRLVAGYTRTATAAETIITRPRYQPPGGDDQKTASFGDLAAAMAWFRAEVAQAPRLCSLALELGRYADCWRLACAMRDYFFTVKALAPSNESYHVALLAAERGGDPWAQAATRNNLGMAYAEQGQFGAALVQHQQALTLMPTLGDSQGLATTLGHHAWMSHAADQHEAAISPAMQANEMNRRYDNRRSPTITDRTTALAYSTTGQHREALGHLAECQEILTELDLTLDVAMTFNCMGDVHCAMGQFTKVDICHAFAIEQSIACGGSGEQARAVKGQAATVCTVGECKCAKDVYQQAAAPVFCPLARCCAAAFIIRRYRN